MSPQKKSVAWTTQLFGVKHSRRPCTRSLAESPQGLSTAIGGNQKSRCPNLRGRAATLSFNYFAASCIFSPAFSTSLPAPSVVLQAVREMAITLSMATQKSERNNLDIAASSVGDVLSDHTAASDHPCLLRRSLWLGLQQEYRGCPDEYVYVFEPSRSDSRSAIESNNVSEPFSQK